MKTDLKEDIFIKVIRFAVEDKNCLKFKLVDLFDYLNADYNVRAVLIAQIQNKGLLDHNRTVSSFGENSLDPNWQKLAEGVDVWCSALDRFRLLEFDELRATQKSAKSASKHAKMAMFIAIVSVLTNIVVSVFQLSSDLKLPDDYYEKISEAVTPQIIAVEEDSFCL
ncbi:MAG: hypothetical protein Alis3KO_26360 [Aliiglaciecola sp.]